MGPLFCCRPSQGPPQLTCSPPCFLPEPPQPSASCASLQQVRSALSLHACALPALLHTAARAPSTGCGAAAQGAGGGREFAGGLAPVLALAGGGFPATHSRARALPGGLARLGSLASLPTPPSPHHPVAVPSWGLAALGAAGSLAPPAAAAGPPLARRPRPAPLLPADVPPCRPMTAPTGPRWPRARPPTATRPAFAPTAA